MYRLYHDSCTPTAVVSSGGHRVDLPVGFWGAVVWKLDSGGKLRMVGQLERRGADPGLAEPRQPVFVDHLPVPMICVRSMCCDRCHTQNCRATMNCCGEESCPCKQVGILRASGEARCRHAFEARSRAWIPCSRSTAVRDDSLALPHGRKDGEKEDFLPGSMPHLRLDNVCVAGI